MLSAACDDTGHKHIPFVAFVPSALRLRGGGGGGVRGRGEEEGEKLEMGDL